MLGPQLVPAMDEWLRNYIPAGCIRVSPDELNLPPESLAVIADLQTWHAFGRRDDTVAGSPALPGPTQHILWSSRVLAPLLSLFNGRWIQLSFKSGIIRVYVYPHDVDRRLSGRNRDGKLVKALSALLRRLDYSPSIWNGSTNSLRWSLPKTGVEGDEDDDGGNYSLLERFNRLPSPNPNLEAVTADSFNAIAMQGILDSKLPGLHTTLFTHQKRSAAVMFQREVEPVRIIDPRLRPALDQEQQSWYFDADAGLVLRSPRFYDGTSGGILAEEMGTGKTLICLALILATKHLQTEAPDPLVVEVPKRRKIASLVDMAAAAINRYSYPWRPYLTSDSPNTGTLYQGCINALERSGNRAYYKLRNPLVETRSSGRVASPTPLAKKIYLSNTSLIIVPNNLVTQWQQEIKKHTSGLRVHTITDNKDSIPPLAVLLSLDILLFSQTRFERMERDSGNSPFIAFYPLEQIRFKRCIVDEGHKLGSRGSQWKSDLSRGLEKLHFAARWVVTGTPSRGLYGMDDTGDTNLKERNASNASKAISLQERDDLQRIGIIASKFLKMRPWSNVRGEAGDTQADWNTYIMQPEHHSRSGGRTDCLKKTLEALIIRTRLSDISHHLPPVDEKIIFLDGSYQDKLSLNLFSMMIIFNSVQSQRTDQDYFFHPRQQKALLQLVSNLKQASFFGGVFFSVDDIKKSLETAENFLEKKEILVSPEDHDLLKAAIDLGKIAIDNQLHAVSNQYHSLPLYLTHFPGGNGKNWSLDDRDTQANDSVCTDAGLVHELQKVLNPCIDAPTSLQSMIASGRLAWEGDNARARAESAAMEAGGGTGHPSSQSSALAGNTQQGVDHHTIRRSAALPEASLPDTPETSNSSHPMVEIAEPLARTQIVSTISTKLSYLIDSIVKYKDEEQIIVFYENDNVAWYLAGVLEILQIHHLIYTRKGLNAQRRAQYVSTFTYNPKFRVLLMDISQAAFGLDMRSASRIYFISPVLNPQIQAQAIGRARRISQQKPVTVETLVLMDSIEELMIERRENMTPAEHRKVKSILDDKPMYDWILNAKILPMPDVADDFAQTAQLKTPQLVFGREYGREVHPDEDLVMESPVANEKTRNNETHVGPQSPKKGGLKRARIVSPSPAPTGNLDAEAARPAKKKVRVAFTDDI